MYIRRKPIHLQVVHAHAARWPNCCEQPLLMGHTTMTGGLSEVVQSCVACWLHVSPSNITTPKHCAPADCTLIRNIHSTTPTNLNSQKLDGLRRAAATSCRHEKQHKMHGRPSLTPRQLAESRPEQHSHNTQGQQKCPPPCIQHKLCWQNQPVVAGSF